MNLVTFLTPTNLAEEKEKFFSSSHYHPQFIYAWDELMAQEWAKKQLRLDELIWALKNKDGKAISLLASKLFETKLEPELLHLAQKIVSKPPERIPLQSISSVVDEFEKALAYLNLNKYSVEMVDQHGFFFRPRLKEKKILASRHMNLDFFSIDGEVRHELTHVIRYENGKYNHIISSESYLPTEEGLAAFFQDYAGQYGHASLFQHAAEYAVTEVALNGSLRDVYNYLESIGFSKELAWQRGIRHKFGFIDTSLPGDIMKPSMYFYHEQLIKALTLEERFNLLVGKISISELNNFQTYTGVIPLDKLKMFYESN